MDRAVRIRIPDDVYMRFKVLCVKMNLSISKQNALLIKHFVEIQEANNAKIEEAMKKGQK